MINALKIYNYCHRDPVVYLMLYGYGAFRHRRVTNIFTVRAAIHDEVRHPIVVYDECENKLS